MDLDELWASQAVPRLRWLVACPSPKRTKWHCDRYSLSSLFSSNAMPLNHHFNTPHIRKTNKQTLEAFKNAILCWILGSTGQNSIYEYIHFHTASVRRRSD